MYPQSTNSSWNHPLSNVHRDFRKKNNPETVEVRMAKSFKIKGVMCLNYPLCLCSSTIGEWGCVDMFCSFLSFFSKHIQKANITFHPNATVSYREYRTYFFEPSMSVGNESDVVTIPNMLVLVRCYFPSLNTNSLLDSRTIFLRLPAFSLPSVFSGCSSDDGKPALCVAFTDQCHLQDFQWGTLSDQDSRGADVGLWQWTCRLPQ